jgi:hypothetical protein
MGGSVQRAAALVTVLFAALTLIAAAPSRSAAPVTHTTATSGPKIVTQPASTGMLRSAGGRIWWSDSVCRLHVEVLATGHVGVVPGVHCRIWPSPDGQIVVATTGPPSSLLINRKLSIISGTSLRQIALLHHRLGYLDSPVSWAPDGASFEFCVKTADGYAVLRDVKPWRHADRPRYGECNPVDGEGGPDLASIVPGDVTLNGKVLGWIQRLASANGVPPPTLRITALAAHGRQVAVGLATQGKFGTVGTPAQFVVLEGGQVRFTEPVIGSGTVSEVGFSPNGAAVWYESAPSDQIELAGEGGMSGKIPTTARRYAWSTDSVFVAVAEPTSIEVFNWRTGQEATIPGISAHDLAWTA